MFFRSPFHDFAASRGEGPRPEFAKLLTASEALRAANVADIASHRTQPMSQAGPNPVGTRPSTLPDNVLPFPASTPGVAPHPHPRLFSQ